MQNYSLFEKIGILFSIIKTSPLFIVSFIIGIILITMLFLDLNLMCLYIPMFVLMFYRPLVLYCSLDYFWNRT